MSFTSLSTDNPLVVLEETWDWRGGGWETKWDQTWRDNKPGEVDLPGCVFLVKGEGREWGDVLGITSTFEGAKQLIETRKQDDKLLFELALKHNHHEHVDWTTWFLVKRYRVTA